MALNAAGAVARAKSRFSTMLMRWSVPHTSPGQAVRSLGQSTRASWLRQSGRHVAAQGPDGRAPSLPLRPSLRLRDGEWVRCRHSATPSSDWRPITSDSERFDASTRLLVRAGEALGLPGEGPTGEWIVAGRVALWWHWVSAENALAVTPQQVRGGPGGAASRGGLPSTHHRIKTRLIVAAATAASGDLDVRRDAARTVVDDAEQAGLTPLRWAGWQLIAGIAPVGAGTPGDRGDDCSGQLQPGFSPARDSVPTPPTSGWT